ncbi:TolB family protein [Robertkochia solimangrovi]|uniref:TolB family protein n=1 Tax=Robertkochia solimangrovi TaxID=2213046 RepID=UPI001181372E|nr:hypothetical protein [Robertkochia solimangrovi]TRZ41414.1 hypothetical protein DMZ48_17160 [Robertkochia solimangrovi]
MKQFYPITLFTLGTLLVFTSCARNKRSVTKQELKIAYNVLADQLNDNFEVNVMNTDGSDNRDITQLPGVEWTYMAHGSDLYIISDKDTCQRCFFLYRTDAYGSHYEKVTDFRVADSWMSTNDNGNEIIVKPHSTVDSVFYIIDYSGKIKQKLTTGLPYSSDPLFINDGRQVIFRGGKTPSKRIAGFDEELYMIERNGEGLEQITHYPATDSTAGQFGYRAGPPRLHPSGEFISYQSKQNGTYSIYTLNLEDGTTKKLDTIQENAGWHDWSPDGKLLAVELFDSEFKHFNIGLMNWETKSYKIITDTLYRFQQAPVFVVSPPPMK